MSPPRKAGCFTAIALIFIAMIGCSSTTHDEAASISSTVSSHRLVGEQDAGSSADQRALRKATVAALSDENRAFVIDRSFRGKTPANVLKAVTAAGATRDRVTLLRRARTPELAGQLESSFSFYAHQEFGPKWTGSGDRSAWLDRDVWASSTFHVDRWQAIRIDGITARVLVRGEDRGTAWAGSPKVDSWAEYKLTLRRDPTAPHGWRVTHQEAASTAA